MNESLQLPTELVKHVTAILGERGVMWLDTLPRVGADIQMEWSSFDEKPENFDDATVAKADIWNV
jgi:hypothetical protein